MSVCKKTVNETKGSCFGFFGIMRFSLSNIFFFENFNFSQRQIRFFFLIFSVQNKMFWRFAEKPFGIFRHCVINEKFHKTLSFSLNILSLRYDANLGRYRRVSFHFASFASFVNYWALEHSIDRLGLKSSAFSWPRSEPVSNGVCFPFKKTKCWFGA